MELTLMTSAILGGATCLIAAVGYALWSQAAVERINERTGNVWKRAYHLGSEIAAGRNVEDNARRLDDLFATTSQPILAAAALAVFVRQECGEPDRAFFRAVHSTRLAHRLQHRLQSSDHHDVVEALEIVEVLKFQPLLGEAAALTRDENPLVVRAACDAVAALDPNLALGVLVGLAGQHDSWVLDSIGRTIRELTRRGAPAAPLSESRWSEAPMLAARVLQESATFDRDTANDAVTTLIGCLDDPSAAKRLTAIKALSSCVSNVAAQLALAGALGSPDRITRYAAAAALSDTVVGQTILRRVAAEGDCSDAARIAAEILWAETPGTGRLELV